MKRSGFSTVLSVFFSLLLALPSVAQTPRLTITQLGGIPTNVGDTITDTARYVVTATVQNSGGGIFQGAIDILIMGNPMLSDTLMSDSTNFLLTPGTSASLTNSDFQFEPTHFDGGDNIIVVWPAARVGFTPGDTITLQLYYLRLLQGSADHLLEPVTLRPNPAVDRIYLETGAIKNLEYVRIYDLSGRVCQDIRMTEAGWIALDRLDPGIYLLEAGTQQGRRYTAKLVKQ